MTKYHDDSSYATDSVRVELNVDKLKFLNPEIFTPFQKVRYKLRRWGLASHIEMIAEHINFGDSQGAIVVKTSPLLIAAYNEDIDCIVMLRFEQKIQDKFNFKTKDKLICVNTFGSSPNLQSDLIPGENNLGMWTEVYPIIADLISDSKIELERRKNEVGDNGYDYIWKLGNEYLVKKSGVYRNGKPFYADQEN